MGVYDISHLVPIVSPDGNAQVFVRCVSHRKLLNGSCLIVLACSNNSLCFVHLHPDGVYSTVTFPWLPDSSKRVASCTFSWPLPYWLVSCGESGDVLTVVPVKLALGALSIGLEMNEFSDGQSLTGLFSSDEFTEINLKPRGDCLALPTSVVWFRSDKGAHYVLFGNKAGEIHVVDLLIRQVTVCIQTPQSVAQLYVLTDSLMACHYLLIKGFAGTEWLLPVEKKGMSVRETLSGVVLPGDLKEMPSSCKVQPVKVAGSLCVGRFNPSRRLFELFHTVTMNNLVRSICVPDDLNIYDVVFSEKVSFALGKESISALLNPANCPEVALNLRRKYSWRLDLPENFLWWRSSGQSVSTITHILEVLVLSGKDSLPTCVLLTTEGIFGLLPDPKAVVNMQLECLVPDFRIGDFEMVCEGLQLDYKTELIRLIPKVLQMGETFVALRVCEFLKLRAKDTVDYFVQHDSSAFILSHLVNWLTDGCSFAPEELQDYSQRAFDLFLCLINEAQLDSHQVFMINNRLKEFLLHNTHYAAKEVLKVLIDRRMFSQAELVMEIHNFYGQAVVALVFQLGNSLVEPEILSLLCHQGSINYLMENPNLLNKVVQRWSVALDLPSLDIVSLIKLLDFSTPSVNGRVTLYERLLTLGHPWKSASHNLLQLYFKALMYYVSTQEQLPKSNERPDEMEQSAGTVMTEEGKLIPIASGPHSCILVTSNGMKMWGRLPKALIIEAQSASSISLSMKLDQLSVSHGITSSSVYENVSYTASMPTLPVSLKMPKEIFGGHQVRQVACGAEHSVVVSQSGVAYAIGINRFGQLGCGDRHNRYEFTRLDTFYRDGNQLVGNPMLTSVVCGLYHTVAVGKAKDQQNLVLTWGWSVHGQLGIPRLTSDVLTPTTVPHFLLLGDEVVQVSAGHCHSLFLTNSGQIYGCGNNTYGQLGLGSLRKASRPRRICLDAKDPSKSYIATHIASGHFHSVAAVEVHFEDESKNIWGLLTWGASPQSLKLKVLLQKRKIAAAASLKRHVTKTPSPIDHAAAEGKSESPTTLTSSLSANDHVTSLLTCDSGDKAHLRPEEVNVTEITWHRDCVVEQIDCGFQHSALLTSKGELWMWGKSMEFQLGLGEKKEQLTPKLVATLSGRKITRVCLGAEHSIAIDSQGLLWGWGRNDFLQLGFQSVLMKEDDHNKGKWANRTVTISKGPDKPARTIQLPQDSRYFVQKPQRLSGLRANLSDQKLEVGELMQRAAHTYTPEALVEAIQKWAGQYDIEAMVQYCCQRDLNELSCFVQAVNGRVMEAFQSHLQWLRNDLVDQMLDKASWTERLIKTLSYYKSSFLQLELYANLLPDAVEHLCQFVLAIKQTDCGDVFDLESFIVQDDFEFWGYGVYCCLSHSDTVCPQVLSPRFILGVVKKFGVEDNIANGNDYRQPDTDGYLELSRRILFENDAETVMTSSNGGESEPLYFFDCGHILCHADVLSRAAALLSNSEFHSRFPSTMGRLQSCLAQVHDQKSTQPAISAQICPLCVTGNLQEVLSHVDKNLV